jgi:hypothetical protein
MEKQHIGRIKSVLTQKPKHNVAEFRMERPHDILSLTQHKLSKA